MNLPRHLLSPELVVQALQLVLLAAADREASVLGIGAQFLELLEGVVGGLHCLSLGVELSQVLKVMH